MKMEPNEAYLYILTIDLVCLGENLEYIVYSNTKPSVRLDDPCAVWKPNSKIEAILYFELDLK